MHKFFLVVLVLIALIFPNSEVFAISECDTTRSDLESVGFVAKTENCMSDPVCFKPISRDVFECFRVKEAAAGGAVTPAALPAAPVPPAAAVPAKGTSISLCKADPFRIEAPEKVVSRIEECPLNTCYSIGSSGFQCYKIQDTSATTEICKPDQVTGKSNCTSASGQACTPGSTDPNSKGPGGIRTAIGCVPTEPKALVEGLLKYGTLAAGGIAFLLMILAALQMITAEGNPESIKAGQEKFYSAIIGLLLIIFAVLLMQVIGVDILGLPELRDPIPK